MSDPAPLKPDPAALDFLLNRRSRPPRMLGDAAPDRDSLLRILTAAARVPDHGKLQPWRFVVLEQSSRARLAELVTTLGAAQGREPARIAKDVEGWVNTPLIVAVIASPKPSDTIPEAEQRASAAAVCLSLVNAALASGWGASWLTGWAAADPAFLTQGLDLFPGESVAGYIHIGNEARVPSERPRPDIEAITSWVTE